MKSPEQTIGAVPDPERQAVAITQESERPVESSERPQQTIEQIKQTLFDPHVISEKYDKEGRKETASEIVRRRQESQSLRGNIAGRENTLAEIERQTQTLNTSRAEKFLFF